MLLAIDCGNTNTVFSIWNGAKFIATWRIASDHKRTADEYFVWLSSLMAMTRIEAQITEAIISSTVPRVVFNLRVLCNRYFDCLWWWGNRNAAFPWPRGWIRARRWGLTVWSTRWADLTATAET
jgi:pantothenate kinase type III